MEITVKLKLIKESCQNRTNSFPMLNNMKISPHSILVTLRSPNKLEKKMKMIWFVQKVPEE